MEPSPNNSTARTLRLLELLNEVRENGNAAVRIKLNELLRSDAGARSEMAALLVDEQALMSKLRNNEIQALLDSDSRQGAIHAAASITAMHATAPKHRVAQSESTNFGRFALESFSRKPMLAAALGVLLGAFCSAGVMGEVSSLFFKPVQLISESFESGSAPLQSGIPEAPGYWNGDYSEVVGALEGLRPHSGARMFHWLRADNELSQKPNSVVGELRRVIDLRAYRNLIAAGGAVAVVSARFNAADVPENERCCSSVSAFVFGKNEEPTTETIREIALKKVDKTMACSSISHIDSNLQTWEKAECELLLPSDAIYLVVQITIGQSNLSQRHATLLGQYLDDIRISLAKRTPLP